MYSPFRTYNNDDTWANTSIAWLIDTAYAQACISLDSGIISISAFMAFVADLLSIDRSLAGRISYRPIVHPIFNEE